MKIEVEKLVLGMVSTNVYLVFYNGNCIIIDPSDEAERIVACIEERKAKPLAIVLTHGHFDHIMAAPALAKKYGIKIYAGEAERQLLEDSGLNLATRFLGEDFTLEADEYVKGGDEIEFEGFKLKVLYTPGHTVGSVSFYTEDLADNEAFKKAAFTGDTLFAGSVGRVDLPTGNEGTMRRTLNEREIMHNPYLR